MSLTFTDMFCGLGGSSIGLTEAGLELKLAANHWARAIETHSTNFPDAEHLCEDIDRYDLRRLPATDILWASPICTELSPAGGRRRTRGQVDMLEELGHVPKAGYDRTRATFWDVIRAAEIHRYKVVLIENVVEAAAWELFDVWLAGMRTLGYEHQIVCVSSAHVGDDRNPHAPQWRDRMYIVFNHRGVRRPDVAPQPLAYCQSCDKVVHARQSWKRPDRRHLVGKYGQQYVYVCPETRCRHAIVEPFVLPAAAAIDWTDPGIRIGDREAHGLRPLAPATLRRIEAGLQMFAYDPTVIAHHGNTWERPGSSYVRAWPATSSPLVARTGTPGDGIALVPFMTNVNHDDHRTYPVDSRPLPSRTTKIGDGLVAPPLIGELRRNSTMTPAGDAPLYTIAASGNHHHLVTPPGAFIQKHHGGLDYPRPEHMVKDVRDPLATVVGRPNLSLVIPYRRGAKPYPAGADALSTVATREQHGVMRPAVDVEDCDFRMLGPREHANAQRIPRTYVITGNKGEQTMQAGNAVSSNVAHFFGRAAAEVLS